MYKLLNYKGLPTLSKKKGTFGGHRGLKIYGLLNCSSALRFISQGKYVKHLIFFANELTAISAGYRPCARCMPQVYAEWKKDKKAWSDKSCEARFLFVLWDKFK
jgi:hypothetical protein